LIVGGLPIPLGLAASPFIIDDAIIRLAQPLTQAPNQVASGPGRAGDLIEELARGENFHLNLAGSWECPTSSCSRCDSLKCAGEIKGELLTIWGRQDPHVPLNGRNLIRARLEEVGANFQWHEVNSQHAFLRDEGPRYDPALAYLCYGLVFGLFHRRLG